MVLQRHPVRDIIQNSSAEVYVRFCKLAGCIVVNYSENDRIKAV